MAGAARRNWLIWVAVLPVALWAPVRLLGLDSGFPLVAMMAFTPWVAVLALLLAGVAVALENWAAAALAALTTVALARLCCRAPSVTRPCLSKATGRSAS